MSSEKGTTIKLGDIIEERYMVVGTLGAGGMGEVYECVDVPSGRHVAIKVPHRELAQAQTFAGRFQRECHILSSIESEHVVECYGHGVLPSGQPYLVMPCLRGGTLADLAKLARDGLRVEYAVALVRQACRGVAVLHERGIWHRDIKPGNLFLTEASGGAHVTVKVLDLGMVSKGESMQAGDDCRTQTSLSAFTSGYSAPEQYLSVRDADARADVYALCAVLFRILTGRRAHGDSAEEIRKNAFQDVLPVPLRVLRPDVPPELEAVIVRGLSRDVALRPTSAAKLSEMLEPFASPRMRSHAVAAERRGSSGAKKRRSYSRGATAFIAALLVILLYVAAFARTRALGVDAPKSSPPRLPLTGRSAGTQPAFSFQTVTENRRS